MLRLAQQVGGHPFGIGRAVRDHQDLGRSGNGVDTDPAEHLPLGFRHEGIAGTDNLVDRRQRARTEGQRGNRLRPADRVEFIHAGLQRGIGYCGRQLAIRRRGDHHDPLDAGNAGRHDVHQHRGRIARPAAGHVHADRVQRRPAPAELNAGFIREAMIGRALRAVIDRDPVMREIDGHAQVCRALRRQRVQVHIVGFQRRRIDLQTVELRGLVGHRRAAARLHVVEDGLHHAEHVFAAAAIFRKEARQHLIELRPGGVKVAGHFGFRRLASLASWTVPPALARRRMGQFAGVWQRAPGRTSLAPDRHRRDHADVQPCHARHE